jgi:hypothetical protein
MSVGRELLAEPPVELLDRAVQAGCALLDQVEEGKAAAAIALGDRDDEAQVRVDHLLLGSEVATLDPPGEGAPPRPRSAAGGGRARRGRARPRFPYGRRRAARAFPSASFFERCSGFARAKEGDRLLGRWRGGRVEATSLASGAREKGNAVAQLRERPPLNMLPACLATHRADRRLPVNDDAAAAESTAVLCPFALPASPRGDHVSLDLGVLGLAHQGDQLRIALARFDDQHPIAVDEASGGGCRLRCQRNRYCVTPVLAVRPNRVAGGSELAQSVSAKRDTVRLARNRH